MSLRVFTIHEERASKPDGDLRRANRVFDIAGQSGRVKCGGGDMWYVRSRLSFDEILPCLGVFHLR